ncbi:MAG: hypothetical protein Q8L08_04020 [Candidatus Nanopelagicaceae bacterium]|nr:hypothetical protein [Candidatus Nanopelagicaceae bacterium]
MTYQTPEEVQRNLMLKRVGIGIVIAMVTFTVTWAVTSKREVKVTFVQPDGSSQSITTGVPNNEVSANPTTSGQIALTETELRSAVKTLGGSIYWAGPMSGAQYALDHIASGQNLVRYLPNGKGLTDVEQNYRVIATYQDANAFGTMETAGKLDTGVSITNPDGSLIYYAKATPAHVYLAFKGLPFQIEIFDPTPGVALKLATTPGLIKSIN